MMPIFQYPFHYVTHVTTAVKTYIYLSPILPRRSLSYICNTDSHLPCSSCASKKIGPPVKSLQIAINVYWLALGRARRRLRHGVTSSLILFLKNIQKSSPSGLQIYDQQAKRVHNIKALSICDHPGAL